MDGSVGRKNWEFCKELFCLCQDITDKGFLPHLKDSSVKIEKMLEELKTRDSFLESVLCFIGGNSVITESNTKFVWEGHTCCF